MSINLANLLTNSQLPLIMGIVNATPDSFSDGNDKLPPVDKALKLLDEGADIIDIGGESTRPDALFVSVEQEIERVIEVVKSLKKLRKDVIISVDTRKKEVAQMALEYGADIINDVSALQYNPEIADIVAKFGAGLILMHSRGNPQNMDSLCNYHNLCDEVALFLQEKIAYAISHGVREENIWIDAGLGFAKNFEQNFELLAYTKELSKIAPVLIGHSRKRFIRDFLQVDIANSDIGSIAVSLFAMNEGAKIIRVHDVKNNYDAIKIYQKLSKINGGKSGKF